METSDMLQIFKYLKKKNVAKNGMSFGNAAVF
jgi:hypothetical protein